MVLGDGGAQMTINELGTARYIFQQVAGGVKHGRFKVWPTNGVSIKPLKGNLFGRGGESNRVLKLVVAFVLQGERSLSK